MATWWVCDMDEGVLHVAGSRADAVNFICNHWGGKVIRRHCYGPGSYDYFIGYDEQDHSVVSIVRNDKLEHYGLSAEHKKKWLEGDVHADTERFAQGG